MYINWRTASILCKNYSSEMAAVEINGDNERLFYRRLLLMGSVTPQENKIYIGNNISMRIF